MKTIDANDPAGKENGRVVLFRNCFNIAPLAMAFERLGYEVWVDRPNAELERLSPGDVVTCITNIHVDIKRPFHFLSVKKRINRLGAPVIFWDRDGPSHMGEKAWRIWLLKHVQFMDAYATHTLQDAGRFSDEVIYLPNAVWDERYNLGAATLQSLRDPARYRYDVSFFGNIDTQKYPEAIHRVRFIDKLKPMLDTMKIRYLFTGASLSIADQLDLIQTSIVNLSFVAGCDVRYRGGYHGEPFSWGLPERCYGVPACGGFLLSDQRPHAADDFTEGVDWVAFSNVRDCIAKIAHYVGNFGDARCIAEAAHRRVMASHRYVDRANKLLRFCLYWKQKRRLLSVPIDF
jgi:spore maturation protein CgeB